MIEHPPMEVKVGFPFRVHAWVAGSIPGSGGEGGEACRKQPINDFHY